jgi:putative toxin-antitoxin system antitoxin component (TIGR02293 family)
MATQLRDVEHLLGVPRTRSGEPLGVADLVETGLPVSALERLAHMLAAGDARFKHRIVPKATLERRRRAKRPLTSEEGDRVARLAKVFAMANSVFRDEGKVRDFLGRPHTMLKGRSPVEVALATGPGADAVVNLIGRAAYSGGA